jgi:murein DD-endopeptidase MepM/ murein hydrolase activator NlpD
MESRLLDQKIKKMMLPTQAPVAGGNLGSAFGWRIDPLNGLSALHIGLDFPSEPGAAILAAAGGVVVTKEYHPAYGNMVEVGRDDELVSCYAYASRVLVKKGDLVKRGQKIAEVGSMGRSTGPHLHFGALVQGVFQDPQNFLRAGQQGPNAQVAASAIRHASCICLSAEIA